MEFGELLKLFLLDLQNLFRSRIASNELTLPQILLISCIPDNGIDMTSLSNRLGVDNSTLTRVVDNLFKKGSVKREKNVHDKRITILKLTASGIKLQELIEKNIDHFGEHIYNSISIEDRDEVKEVLSNFHWTLSKILMKNEKFV